MQEMRVHHYLERSYFSFQRIRAISCRSRSPVNTSNSASSQNPATPNIAKRSSQPTNQTVTTAKNVAARSSCQKCPRWTMGQSRHNSWPKTTVRQPSHRYPQSPSGNSKASPISQTIQPMANPSRRRKVTQRRRSMNVLLVFRQTLIGQAWVKESAFALISSLRRATAAPSARRSS